MKASAFAGFFAGLAVAAASAVALVQFGNGHNSGSPSAPSTPSGSVSSVTNAGTDNARNVYNGAKNSVAYISAETDQGPLRVVGGHAGLDFDPKVAERMRQLTPGEWLRLLDAQGEHVAAKVAWVSPLTGRFLLVNRRGVRVLVASAEQLASLAAEGRLVAGTEQAPFDEAMRQLQQRLSRAVGQN